MATTAADHLSDRYPTAPVLDTFVVLVVSTVVLRALLDDARQAVERIRLRAA